MFKWLKRLFRLQREDPPDIVDLRASQRDIEADIRDQRAFNLTELRARLAKHVNAAGKRLERLGQQARAKFAGLQEKRRAATASFRNFQVGHGLTNRPVRKPNGFITYLWVQGSWCAEAAMTAGLAVADGTMALLGALAYGGTVATLNIGLSLAAGFYCLRFAGYGMNAPKRNPHHTRIRWAARLGFLGLLAAIIAVNFAAARARALGSYQDIFNFETLSIASTVQSYWAVALLTLGGLGALIGIHKGFRGVSDYPGYREAQRAAEDQIDDAADDLHGRLLDAADAAFASVDELLAELDERAAEQVDLAYDLARRIAAHNHAIDAAIERLREDHARDAAEAAFIDQEAQKPAKPGVAALERLRIDPALLPEIDAARDTAAETRARLDDAYDQCIAAIEDAHSDFSINTPAFGLKR